MASKMIYELNLKFILIKVFTDLIGMLMISFGNCGTGKITYSSLKAHSNSTPLGKISPLVDKKNSPLVASPLMGIFCHLWWNWDVP